MPDEERLGGSRLENFARTAEFWRRSSGIYLAYKLHQVKAWGRQRQGWDAERLRKDHWQPHHTWAGVEFHKLAVDLRGFYLKLGQFFAARAEFVPEPICRKLALLHDQVPPMSPQQTRSVMQAELGGVPIEDVFEWIDLEQPLGSASIAQVHKARLKGAQNSGKRPPQRPWWALGIGALSLNSGHGWDSADTFEDAPLRQHTKRRPLWRKRKKQEQQPVAPPDPVRAATEACRSPDGPEDGVVAVKVQYPNCLPTMMLDLKHIRVFAGYLRKTEIKFDLVSAVDELATQVRKEFDFEREALIMDAVADNLQGMRKEVEIPRSVPGLVTPRLLVMNFVPGTQITRLRSRMDRLSAWQRERAKQRILSRVTAAFGHMMLVDGLFQADAHPGNILVQPGGRIGLLDFGQSKRLPEPVRLALARLMLELGKGRQNAEPRKVAQLLHDLGLRFSKPSDAIQMQMAFGMFDSRLSHRVDPFAANSPIKKLEIQHFPHDVFFVLRVVQLLRGLAGGMQVGDFSTAEQWGPYARRALKHPPKGDLSLE